ncbi:MAG: M3 family metallopeptidase [bacterium]|nr:M3 family metallopeptidase [bacterium]
MTHKTSWNLRLLYDSVKDKRIEKDTKEIEEAYRKFERKYKKLTGSFGDPKILLSALRDCEKLLRKTSSPKPLIYFLLRKEICSNDCIAESSISMLMDRLAKSHNRVIFFRLALGRLTGGIQSKLLKNDSLKPYRYYLTALWKNAAHQLSESEERILNLLELPSSHLWKQGQEKLLNSQTVAFEGKAIPISEALNLVKSLPAKKRAVLHNKTVATLKSISHFAESELNALYTKKKVEDNLRGFKESFDSTILEYENNRQSVLAMVEAVKDSFAVSRKFYRLKSKALGLKKLGYADRSVSLSELSRKFTLKESVAVVREGLSRVSSKYADMLSRFLENGQIDVFPKIGKHGGAFCAGNINMPTFLLLNHTDDIRSVTTLGHEMGHAIHTEMSKSQSVIYESYTTSTAEVASTLFENFVFDALLEKLTEKERAILLHERLGDAISTVYRQVACFEFEYELHKKVRMTGSVSKEEIAALHNKHMLRYLGSSFSLNPNDGYFFVAWSHLRRPFYVYSYAYGYLISRVLYERVKLDASYERKVAEFLGAGGSDTPENIFKNVGIDTTDGNFWREGIKSIEGDLEFLEKAKKQ